MVATCARTHGLKTDIFALDAIRITPYRLWAWPTLNGWRSRETNAGWNARPTYLDTGTMGAMAVNKWCQICLGPRKSGKLSFLFCDDCRNMIAKHRDYYRDNRKPGSYWFPWAREKTRAKRAANILKYGDNENYD